MKGRRRGGRKCLKQKVCHSVAKAVPDRCVALGKVFAIRKVPLLSVPLEVGPEWVGREGAAPQRMLGQSYLWISWALAVRSSLLCRWALASLPEMLLAPSLAPWLSGLNPEPWPSLEHSIISLQLGSNKIKLWSR